MNQDTVPAPPASSDLPAEVRSELARLREECITLQVLLNTANARVEVLTETVGELLTHPVRK